MHLSALNFIEKVIIFNGFNFKLVRLENKNYEMDNK